MAKDLKNIPELEGSEPDQSKADKKLVEKKEEQFLEAKTYRDQTTKRWIDNTRIHENKQEGVSTENTNLKINLSLVDVRAQMNIISDFLPSIDVMPRKKASRKHADSIHVRIKQVLEDAEFRDKVLDVIEQSLILSNGLIYAKPEVESEEIDDNGLAKDESRYDYDKEELIEFDSETLKEKIHTSLDIRDVDPRTCFPAPGATDITLDGARYIIFATPMHVDELFRLYKIKVPAEGHLDNDGTFSIIDESHENYKKLANSVLLKECYEWDNDRKKYPCGRETFWANGVFIHSKPMWDGFKPKVGRFSPGIPYFCLRNYGTSRKWIGVGEPEIVGKIKKSLDQTVSAVADNVLKMGNPAVKVTQAWLDWCKKKIRHKPAEQITVLRPSDVTFMPPESVPQSSFAFFELLMKINQIETGVQEVSLGKRDKRVESGRAIEALQEAAESVVRHKINTSISKFLTSIGKQVVWYLQEYDKEPMEILQEGKLDEEGNPVFFEYNPEGIKESEFNIKVVPGIRLRQGRLATEERALMFMEKGIYGIEDVVNDLNIENKQEIIDGFHRRQGILDFKNGYEALQKAIVNFEALCGKAIKSFKSNSEWIGTIEEEKLSDLIYQFQEFLVEDYFVYLPLEYKKRLVSVFLQPPVDKLAEVGSEELGITS